MLGGGAKGRIERRKIDKTQEKKVYKYIGQAKSIKISVANFLFFIVCSLLDLGGQGIRLCYCN